MRTQRYSVGVPIDIEITTYVDGAAQDANVAPTLTVVDAAGDPVLDANSTPITNTAVSKPSGTTGIYRYTIPEQPEVDVFTAAWVTPDLANGNAATFQTRLEIVGGHLVTIEAIRTWNSGEMADPVAYPLQALVDTRDDVTDDLSHEVGYQLIPRFTKELVSGDGTSRLLLDEHRTLRCLAAWIDDAAVDLSDVTLHRWRLDRAAAWPAGLANVTVHYVAGVDPPPPGAADAALHVIRERLVETGDGTDESLSRRVPIAHPTVTRWIDAHAEWIGVA